MNTDILFLSCVILLSFSVSLFFIRKWLTKSPGVDLLPWLQSMQNSLDNTNRNMNEALRGSSFEISRALRENSQQLNSRLDTAATLISQVQRNLGEMTEFGKGIKDIQEFLNHPKLRGNLGEQILVDMLKQILPTHLYKVQHSFRSGNRVDAAIVTAAGLLCIDSKFPMSNFRLIFSSSEEVQRERAKKDFIQDVKKHTSSISEKYINPDEGTVDIAFMYIPSESVFYEIASNSELTDFASQKRIIPVSPATLYAYLKGVLMAYQSKQLQDKSFELLKLIKSIQGDYSQIEDSLGVLGRHVTNAYNQMSQVSVRTSSLGTKLNHAQLLSGLKDDSSKSSGGLSPQSEQI